MATKVLGPTGSRRRRRFILGPMLLMIAISLFWVVAAQAVHDDGFFELDRNAVSAAATPGDDWDLVYAETDNADVSRFQHDDNRIYTGGATKDDLDITGWHHTAGSVPDKDELLDGFAARYGDHLYFGADRYANNGDAVIGIWFFQSTVAPLPDGSFSGQHTDGDLLALSDFTKGGETSTIRVFRWNGPGGSIAGAGAINGTLDLLYGTTASPADCVGPPAVANGDPACATVNAGPAASPWPFVPKTGASNIFPKGEFYEGGIDLGAPQLNLGGECFSSVILETRSSQSVDAVLKDFVAENFESCGANITIGQSAVNKVGDSHTFTVTVSKTVSGTQTGVAGVYPTVTLTASSPLTQSDINITGNTCVDDGAGPNTGTDSNGQCTVTFTSSKPGIITGSASATVTIDGTSFSVHTGSDATASSPDAIKRFVDAKISLSPLTDTNGIGEDHVVTATVQQDDGLPAADANGDGVSGWANAPNGTLVSFSLANNTAGAVFKPLATTTCTTTSGTCTITITTTTAGSVDIHATTTFSVGGQSITRATGTGGNNSADANKVYIDGTLRWLKRANSTDGPLLGGAQFSVCRTHTWDSGTGTMVDTDDVCLGSGTPAKIADDELAPGGTGPNADNDPDSGEFQLSQLVLGRYVITETDAPAGYALDPTPQTVNLTLTNPSNANGDADDVIPVFVDAQLFRVIVITCNDSLNPKELVDSTVTIGNTEYQTITSVPADLAAKTVTQADLCGIGGAAVGGLPANPSLGVSVEVPDKAPLFP